MKILFSVKTYYPNTDGVSNVTRYLAEGLAKRGHEVTIITENDKKFKSDEVINGTHVVRMSFSNSVKENKKMYIENIHRYIGDVFVCVCTEIWCLDWVRREIDKLTCKKILYTHGFSGLYSYPGDCKHGITRCLKSIKYWIKWRSYYFSSLRLIKKFDAITHLSIDNKSYGYLTTNGVKNNYVLGNGVEEVFYEKPVCFQERADCPFKYVYVAAFTKGKNQRELVDAYVEANADNSELILIGNLETDYYFQLLSAVEKYELEGKLEGKKIIFKVGLSRKEISDYMGQCDACVITSLREAYSLSLLEACAKGLAIVSTDVGNAHLIPGVMVVKTFPELVYMIQYLRYNKDLCKHIGKLVYQYAISEGKIDEKIIEFENIIYATFNINHGVNEECNEWQKKN